MDRSWSSQFEKYDNVLPKRVMSKIDIQIFYSSKWISYPKLTWFLTGHDSFAGYSARMKLRSSGSCRCDEENDQSALHLLCPDMMVESSVRKIRAFLGKESRPLNAY